MVKGQHADRFTEQHVPKPLAKGGAKRVNGQSAAVVICTMDRAREVSNACEAASQDNGEFTLIVVDASADSETEKVVERFQKLRAEVDVHYVRAGIPGLAKQRNQAAEVCQSLGVKIMHYIDDDTEVLPGYFQAIEARFANDPDLAGVGGIIENSPKIPIKAFKLIFLLWGPYGSVLRSGRATSAQHPRAQYAKADREGRGPKWLHGCAMSYRTDIVLQYRFDDRLEGYSNGEDIDFGFRVSRNHPLAAEPSARCLHRVSQGGLSREAFAYSQAVVIYSWVREHRSDGMSLVAFWWSVLGDLLLHAVDGVVVPRRGGLQYAKGMLWGMATIAMGRATRSS
jgi:GT2 family glycosyltransferase